MYRSISLENCDRRARAYKSFHYYYSRSFYATADIKTFSYNLNWIYYWNFQKFY